MKYFDAFGEGGFYSAFLTTYAFGAQAFEDVPFPKLRGAGCRNIVVLADRQMTNQSFAEYGPPRFAGSSYHLIKVDAPGAFHPKITMLVGPKKGRLMIGSANLTALGLGGNKELVANIVYSPEMPGHAHYFAEAIEYIRRYVPADDAWFATALQRAMRRAPWLRTAVDTPAIERDADAEIAILLDRPEITILDQIVRQIGSDPIERLIVVSPYWDTRLEGLARLRNALGTPQTDLLIESGTTGFPKSELDRFSGIGLFDVDPSESKRFVHAKLLVAQSASWDHVISGSMNCTFPALMGPSVPRGNAEAGIYKRVARGTALEALALDGYRSRPLPPSAVAEMTMSMTTKQDQTKFIDGGALTIQLGRLSWSPPPQNPLRNPVALSLLDRDGLTIAPQIELDGSGKRNWQLDPDTKRPKSAEVSFSDGSISAPVQIADLDILAVATLPPLRGKKKPLSDILAEALNEDLILIETLNQLEALEAEEDDAVEGHFAKLAAAKPAVTNPQAYQVLSYEEFVRARSLSHARGGIAGNFLNGRHDSAANTLSACLNRLIGLVSADLGEAEDKDLQALNAIDFRSTEPVAPVDPERRHGDDEDLPKKSTTNAQSLATAKKMQEAVTAFEGRCKALKGKSIGTAELVRLRALLQIILTHSQAIQGKSTAAQILPVYTKDGYDWPRLIGRLLKQHFGTVRALQQLQVEQDEAEQKRVMEYLALADWASQAAVQAVKANPKAMDLRGPLEGLAKTLQSQVSLILGDVAEDKQYFSQLHAKLDERFSTRLGLQLPKAS
jgi:hypothetical protein